jgi:pantetheine-phosphate adenylyltransferase
VKRIGIYAGSFDPFTMGHLDIVERASPLFDEVIVALLTNQAKSPVFTLEERIRMLEAAVGETDCTNVRTGTFDGLLVDYAAQVGAKFLIRGLRSAVDFEYERQIDTMNRRLSGIETVYLLADAKYGFLSSSIVKEVGSLGGSIDGLVPEINRNIIVERVRRK